jgi:hypothetical protein
MFAAEIRKRRGAHVRHFCDVANRDEERPAQRIAKELSFGILRAVEISERLLAAEASTTVRERLV